MKRLLPVMTLFAFLGFVTKLPAQTNEPKDSSFKEEIRESARTAGKEIKQGAEKVSDKTAEIAVKGASAVADKIYKDKTGPDGQTIFIDGHAQFYWVNEKGKKVYVPADELIDKK